MKDILGNELSIGDQILFIDKKYQELKIGYIISIGKVQVTIRDIEYPEGHQWANTMAYGKTCRYGNCVVKTFREKEQNG